LGGVHIFLCGTLNAVITVGEILVAEDMEAEDDALVFQPGKPLLLTPSFPINLD
jgi:hypothetical protein